MNRIVFALGVVALFIDPVQSATGVAGLAGWQLWSVLQLITTTCLVLTLLYAPGLLWPCRAKRSTSDLALAIVPGPVLLSLLGLACWLLGQWLDPVVTARAGVLLMLGWIAWRGSTVSIPERLPAAALAVITAGALVVGFAVAKASYSTGPAGELYGGTISRTLEVGGHADSRISFHVVQLVAHNFPPFPVHGSSETWRRVAEAVELFGRDAPPYFAPWTFASRGPLAGLIAAPIVLATGAAVPQSFPDHAWQPFDHQGFSVYRITLIVLASLTGWALFGAAAAILPPPWPVLASVIALLAPFYVHELYFTWPKLAAAGFVLASFTAATTGRAFAAGVLLAVGYLVHPLAILSAPVLGVWVFARRAADTPGVSVGARLQRTVLFGAGVLALVMPWILFGILGTGSTSSQGGFVDYFRMADGRYDVPWIDWWRDRWQSFANTFVPLHLLTVDQTNRSINALNAHSDRWVRAGFLYWNTLPFALGLPAFALLVPAIGSAARRALGAVLLFVVAPAVFLTLYWGDSNVGLMRFCGHVLFVSVIGVGAWGLSGHAAGWTRRARAAFLHPACFAWRGLEVFVMAFGTTLLARRSPWDGPFAWSDAASLLLAAACLTSAVVILRNVSATAFAAQMPEPVET